MRPLIKVPVKFGLIAGFLGALLVIGLYYIDRHPFLVNVFFDFRIFLFGIFIFFSLKEFRDYYQEGTLYFWQGMIASFIFISVYALLASSLIWIFANYEQRFVSSFIDLFREQVKALSEEDVRQIGKDQIERNLKALDATNAFWMAFNYFKQCYWIGLVLSIIISVILRRQPKT